MNQKITKSVAEAKTGNAQILKSIPRRALQEIVPKQGGDIEAASRNNLRAFV